MAHQWYILQDNREYGPYSEEHMRSFIDGGRLKGETLVWRQGMKDWVRATDIEPFRSYFTGARARPTERTAPPAEPAITPEGHGGGRKIAAVGALVVVVIIAGLGIWWIYPRLSWQSQPGQQAPTGPAFGEAEGTLYTAKEEGVHDGDTINLSVPLTRINSDIQSEVSDLMWGSYVRVRFAKINAPELENVGGSEARNFVKQLIASGGNRVYLDLDNYSEPRFKDVYGLRLLVVVYVVINNKLVNVNAEVLRWGQANYPGHTWIPQYAYPIPSEFNPEEWLAPSYPYVR